MNAIVGRLVAERPIPGFDPTGYEVTIARSLNDLMQVVALRAMIYMTEQDCPFDEEFDGNDFAGATHLVLRFRGEPVGVMRVRWFAEFAKLERLAVLKTHRGRAPLALARFAVQLAQRKGYRRVMGHAAPRVVAFWAKYFHGKARLDRPKVVFSGQEYVEVVIDLAGAENALSVESDPMLLLRPEGDWDRPGVLDRSSGRPVIQAAA